jgi:tripartite-type tricarboxylate transporter receptor subunit TctC
MLAPDVPTIAESGSPGFALTTGFHLDGAWRHAGRDRDAAQARVRKAVDTPEFRDRFSEQDIWVVASGAAEAASRIKPAPHSGSMWWCAPG